MLCNYCSINILYLSFYVKFSPHYYAHCHNLNWLTLYSTLVTVCTTSLTFSNSSFYQLNLYIGFIWFSESGVCTFLISIKWLMFVIEKRSVFFEVATKFLMWCFHLLCQIVVTREITLLFHFYLLILISLLRKFIRRQSARRKKMEKIFAF